MGSAGSDRAGAPAGGDPDERGVRTRVVEWVLVGGSRIGLALGASAAVFASLLVAHAAGVIAFTNDDSITRMASGMIAGTFSLVTLVVSVNQLILSQEFSLAGQFRDRLGDVREFRRDVEDAAGVPAAPAEPTRLLDLLATTTRDRAGALADAADREDGADRERVVGYATAVADSTGRIDETLDHARGDAFEALSTAVEYDESRQIYAGRHLRNDTPGLSAETEAAFDDLIDALELFKTAREHFKTVYLQRELTRFSQLTVYCGLPAVCAAVAIVLLYGGTGGATIAARYLPYAVSLLTAVVTVPLALLATYILRTATLTRRTAAVGPLLTEKPVDEGPLTVSYGEE